MFFLEWEARAWTLAHDLEAIRGKNRNNLWRHFGDEWGNHHGHPIRRKITKFSLINYKLISILIILKYNARYNDYSEASTSVSRPNLRWNFKSNKKDNYASTCQKTIWRRFYQKNSQKTKHRRYRNNLIHQYLNLEHNL